MFTSSLPCTRHWHKWVLATSELCECGVERTMNHTVDSCLTTIEIQRRIESTRKWRRRRGPCTGSILCDKSICEMKWIAAPRLCWQCPITWASDTCRVQYHCLWIHRPIIVNAGPEGLTASLLNLNQLYAPTSLSSVRRTDFKLYPCTVWLKSSTSLNFLNNIKFLGILSK